MTLGQLQMFVAVVTHRSFSKAALELNLSQAAVSYAIQELERDLGVKLLKRGRFGAQPTELGEQVAEHALRMLQDEQGIRQLVFMAQGHIRGKLRVAAFHTILTSVMPNALSTAVLKYPELRIQMFEPHLHDPKRPRRHSSLHLLDTLHNGQSDVAFFQYPFPETDPAANDLLLWGLLDDFFVALVPRQWFPESAPSELPLHLLREAPLIFNPENACGVMLTDYLQRHANSAISHYAVQDDGAVPSMAAKGIGIGLLPRLAVDHLPDEVLMLPLVPPLIRTLGVAIKSESFKVPVVRAFLDALRVQFPASRLPAFTVPPPALSEATAEGS
jgi:DNA-binding transcriptional LysR family regulator